VEAERRQRGTELGSAVVGDTALDDTTVRKPPVGYIEHTQTGLEITTARRSPGRMIPGPHLPHIVRPVSVPTDAPPTAAFGRNQWGRARFSRGPSLGAAEGSGLGATVSG
jgi:hypothetical protein